MLKDRIEDSITFDDVLLLPGHSKLLPSEVSVKSRITQTLRCNIPLLSAAMDTVTEHQTAICMAQEGGMGIIHKNMSSEDQARQVNLVKRSESGMISDPITVEPDEPLQITSLMLNCDTVNIILQYISEVGLLQVTRFVPLEGRCRLPV